MTNKKEIYEELRLLKGYTERKLKELENTLKILIKYARDDLKRLDKFKEKLNDK